MNKVIWWTTVIVASSSNNCNLCMHDCLYLLSHLSLALEMELPLSGGTIASVKQAENWKVFAWQRFPVLLLFRQDENHVKKPRLGTRWETHGPWINPLHPSWQWTYCQKSEWHHPRASSPQQSHLADQGTDNRCIRESSDNSRRTTLLSAAEISDPMNHEQKNWLLFKATKFGGSLLCIKSYITHHYLPSMKLQPTVKREKIFLIVEISPLLEKVDIKLSLESEGKDKFKTCNICCVVYVPPVLSPVSYLTNRPFNLKEAVIISIL